VLPDRTDASPLHRDRLHDRRIIVAGARAVNTLRIAIIHLDDGRVCAIQECSHGGNALRAMGSLTMQLRNFAAALHEHCDMLVDQMEFIERGNQVIAFGEEAEASTAKFLATLRSTGPTSMNSFHIARRCD